MEKKRVVILGGGISGLSLAYALRKEHNVQVIEKSTKAGGWLQTVDEGEFLFEMGPRTFRTRRSGALLRLVIELGLQGELIPSDEKAKVRYLYRKGDLQKLPSHPLELFFSPLTRAIWPKFLGEWRKKAKIDDETIWEFASRRFGVEIAERLFDPMTLGIYAGDAKTLSVDACFPKLKEWERGHGSVTAGCWHALRKKKQSFDLPEQIRGSSLFSFRKGVHTLVEALCDVLKETVRCNTTVQGICQQGDDQPLKVMTSEGSLEADLVISALPPQIAASLLVTHVPETAEFFSQIPMASIRVVHIGYHREELKKRGFGYLVPTSEREPLMGVIFDSAVFPQQNRHQQTRLTAMIREVPDWDDGAYRQYVLDVLQRHLGIGADPDYLAFHHLQEAIPQMLPGHRERMACLEGLIKEKLPKVQLVGNYLRGVSVNDCLMR